MRRSEEKTRDQERLNGNLIMMEGLFNTLGVDIIGLTTIVPLFLTYLGANLETVGVLTTIQSVCNAVVPLLCGGMVAAARSKRNFSMLINGMSRSSILLIPLGLALGLRGSAELSLFFGVIAFYFLCQPITSLSWSYLLGDCVAANRRGKLLGTLYALSGLITFVSSAIIKAIRGSALSVSSQYACIFTLGGTLLGCSVLFYLPLKEKTYGGSAVEGTDFRGYLRELAGCFREKLFLRVIRTNIFSQLSIAVNAFFFVYAQDVLGLSVNEISNLIVVQTFGVMAGGLVAGRVSERFGIKRMLQLVEGLGALVPVMGLLAKYVNAPFLFAAVAVLLIGFSRSGLSGYQAYILEIVPTDKSVYHIAARSLSLLPFAVASVAIGWCISHFGNTPVFVLQLIICMMAFISASTLRLNVYRKKRVETA